MIANVSWGNVVLPARDMYVRRRGTLVEVQTPAKVNLFLEVLSRRADGYHEIETLMTPVGLFDRVSLAANSTGTLSFTCRWSRGVESQRRRDGSAGTGTWEAIPAGEDNLLVKSVRRLRELAGVRQGADMALVKRIPMAAGLGGASSDAAAGLAAANVAWGLGWSRRRLAEVAAEIGSDVPFFLQGGPCLCRGRGEQIESITGWQPLHMVVVKPPAGLSTAHVYRVCRLAEQTRSVDAILAAGRRGDAVNVGRLLFNRLEQAAEQLSPWIERLQNACDRLDCLGYRMSGSGTSFVGICRHADHARRVAARLRAAGWSTVFATRTLHGASRCE
ncbi:MAG: 4-(cytidine 5'-diphospho)-2-C-methyl-D-erythritol kinase [Candidatus Anammoximicrobium sp.]|nr:4-(cytidine 5'-diphospho)-2-C-methyl-D-erythritol kinase [Candidatus Anammoximicrobium sp.]